MNSVEVAASVDAGRGSVDPFALPTETRGRFHLLMVAAWLLVWSLPFYFVDVAPPIDGVRSVDDALGAEESLLLQRVTTEGWTSLSRAEKARVMELSDRLGGLERKKQVARALGSVGLVLLVTLGAVFMAWLRRVDRPPLLPEQTPKVFHDLDACCRRFGIVPVPRLSLRRGWLDGQAGAGSDGPVVVLAGDRRRLDLCWSDLHRSVLLHELGHLANGDFHVRELARWLWRWAVGLVAVFMGGLVVQGRHGEAADLAFKTLVFGVIIRLLWASLVRDRELYADLRAVTWGYDRALRRRLSLPEVHGSAATGVISRFLRSVGLWRVFSAARHPSNAERLAALARPEQSFRVSVRLAVVTGLLLSIAVVNAGPLVQDLSIPVGVLGALLMFLPIAGVWVVALLLLLTLSLLLLWMGGWTMASIGAQVLRWGVYQASIGTDFSRSFFELWMPVCGLILGFQVGLLPWTGLARSALPDVGSLVLSVPAVWLWFGWIHGVGYWVLPAMSGSKKPKVLIALTFVTGAVLWVPAIWPLAGRWLWAAAARLSIDLGGEGIESGVQMLLAMLSLGAMAFIVATYAVSVLTVLWRRRCPCCGLHSGDRPSLRLGFQERCAHCGRTVGSWIRLEPTGPWLDRGKARETLRQQMFRQQTLGAEP